VILFGPALHDVYYLARIRARLPLPPVKLQYWASIVTIRDGNHRVGAAIETGLDVLLADWRLESGEADEWIELRLRERLARAAVGLDSQNMLRARNVSWVRPRPSAIRNRCGRCSGRE
jgi:hypothetical protein